MHQDKIKNRQRANREILELLKAEVERNPDIRFGQMLRNIGVVLDETIAGEHRPRWINEFNTESVDVLARIKERSRARGGS